MTKYILDNINNREFYKEIYNDEVVEVILIMDHDDKKNCKYIYNEKTEFHLSHGTWKDLCYKNIFMWKVLSVEIIKQNHYDLFTYKEINA